ncbi:hypothetical protein D9M73_112930 [compost metagenome]
MPSNRLRWSRGIDRTCPCCRSAVTTDVCVRITVFRIVGSMRSAVGITAATLTSIPPGVRTPMDSMTGSPSRKIISKPRCAPERSIIVLVSSSVSRSGASS